MSEKQFKLSKKKAKWAKQFKPQGAARGPALNTPKGVEVTFTRDVQKIINAVIRETQKIVRKLFKTPSARDYFAEDSAAFTNTANKSLDALFERLSANSRLAATKTARKMAKGANQASRASMAASLKELSGGVTLNPSDLGGNIPTIMQASIESNAGLIVNITDTYILKVSDAVNRSIMNGRGLQDLIPFFRAQTGVSKRHGKNVALDQTRKAFNALNVARMENVGLSKFEWVHSGGGQKPRELHITPWPEGLNGGIFDIHDPPIIELDPVVRGLPSEAINCKCRIAPVLVFDDEEPAT